MTDEVGYKKPPKKNQIGQAGGPTPGKTKAQKRQEMLNAEKAVEIRGKLLDALGGALDEGDDVLGFLNQNTLKMLKDAEDRGLGAPVQPTVGLGDENTPKGMRDFYAIGQDD